MTFEVPRGVPTSETFDEDVHRAAPLSPPGLRYIGGVDISYDVQRPNEAIAVLAVLRSPSLETVQLRVAEVSLTAPYIPSFLAFREAHHLLALLRECPEPRPQLLFVDGNGRLHEREAGLAVALGVETDLPTLAVAKTYQPVIHGAQAEAHERFDLHRLNALCRAKLGRRGDWLALPDASLQRTLGAMRRPSVTRRATLTGSPRLC
jgi:deoxyinosine 3'endonuclease (endonuclease V)